MGCIVECDARRQRQLNAKTVDEEGALLESQPV